MQLQLKETNRLDFCELGRYQDFDTWQEFKEFYCDGAVDTLKESEHFLIRWDIKDHYDCFGEKEGYELWLFYLNQQLGENHCLFRWDIDEHYNIWTGEKEGYELRLYYIDQRLGEYHSCVVEQITQEDLPELKAYLQKSWKYLQSIWQPFLYQEGM